MDKRLVFDLTAVYSEGSTTHFDGDGRKALKLDSFGLNKYNVFLEAQYQWSLPI